MFKVENLSKTYKLDNKDEVVGLKYINLESILSILNYNIINSFVFLTNKKEDSFNNYPHLIFNSKSFFSL